MRRGHVQRRGAPAGGVEANVFESREAELTALSPQVRDLGAAITKRDSSMHAVLSALTAAVEDLTKARKGGFWARRTLGQKCKSDGDTSPVERQCPDTAAGHSSACQLHEDWQKDRP